MEEAFPYRFTSGIRAYWRHRKYHRLEPAAARARSVPVRRLGTSRRMGFRPCKPRPTLRFRLRQAILSPTRLLGRVRDMYVNAMLGLGSKHSGFMQGNGPEPRALWAGRVPKSRKVQTKREDHDWKLVVDVYKSLIASGRITE